MHKITKIISKDNKKIKQLRKLQHKKYQDKLDLFCVENLVIIYDALRAGHKFESLFISQKLLDRNSSKLQYVLKQIDRYFLIDSMVNKTFSSLETSSGICAVYKKFSINTKLGDRVVYLNGIKDPGNMGTILRTSLAFGFKSVVIDEESCDIYNSKVINSSKDAIFKLNIFYDRKLAIIKDNKTEYKILATNAHNGDNVKDLKSFSKYFIVFGNETKGVSSEILNLSDNFIRLKIAGNIESLNVATTVAIILYELAKDN